MKNKKILLFIITIIILQLFLYMVSKFIQGPPTIVNIKFDDYIPLVAAFIYPYIIWYILLFLVPLILYKYKEQLVFKYLTTHIICILIAFIIYIIYPSTLVRDELVVTNIATYFLNIIYTIDNPAINLFPSIHCTLCFLFIFSIYKRCEIPKYQRVSIYIMSVLIIFSTLFTKQHVVVDVIAAFVMTGVVYYFVDKFELWKKMKSLYEKVKI